MLDLASLHLFCRILTAAVIVAGLMGNGFIIIASCYDWIRRKTLSSSNIIALALSLSRFLFLGITLSIYGLLFHVINNPVCMSRIIIFFWFFSNTACLWVASVLVAFYCMKIVNFTQPFLVKMKLRISGMVFQILIGSFMVSLLFSVPIFWYEDCTHFCNGTKILLDSSNGTCLVYDLQNLLATFLYSLGTFLSAIIYLISSVFLICSLVHHVKRNTEGFSDQSIAVHLRAIKVLVSFLILYSASFILQISINLFPNTWIGIMSITVVSGYHLGHSISLIVMDSELKQAFNKVWCDAMRQCLSKIQFSSHSKTSKETCSP